MARYKGVKGKYWTLLSEYVRKRDFIKYGKCITCGKKVNDWRELQAGHFAPASNCGFGLLFDTDNVHGECPYDNGFNEGHLIHYKTNLIKRYGEEFVSKLESRYNNSRYKGITTKEWSKSEYEEKIIELKEKIRKLDLQL